MIIDRVYEIIKYKKMSISAFEKFIGSGRNTIATPLKNKTTLGSGWLVEILSKLPEISAEWLMRGEGEMRKTQVSYLPKEEIIQTWTENQNEYGINWHEKYKESEIRLDECRKNNEMLTNVIKGNGTSG